MTSTKKNTEGFANSSNNQKKNIQLHKLAIDKIYWALIVIIYNYGKIYKKKYFKSTKKYTEGFANSSNNHKNIFNSTNWQ